MTGRNNGHLLAVAGLAVVARLLVGAQQVLAASRQGGQFYQRPGVGAAEIIRARGYAAEENYLVSRDGYVLQLVHAWNPLLQGNETLARSRAPILFVHGLMAQANAYVLNSFEARPRDWSAQDADQMAREHLLADPSSKSLPLLAMNFGHHVWLLNRRGAPGSRQKLEPRLGAGLRRRQQSSLSSYYDPWQTLTSALGALLDFEHNLKLIPLSFDSNFWSYSMDEQAMDDLPLVVEHIGRQSDGSKVALVGHSEGGAIALMALSEREPAAKLARWLSSATLWSPAFAVGLGDSQPASVLLMHLFQAYFGSLPPVNLVEQIEANLALLCSTNTSRWAICDSLFGPHEPLQPQFISAFFYASSPRELAQFQQCINKYSGNMHHYDFGSKHANRAKYNQSEPPAYEANKIDFKHLSLYVGREDTSVSVTDVRFTSSKLKVAHEFHLIDEHFGHQGYFFNEHTARLAVIPSLIGIQKFSKQ